VERRSALMIEDDPAFADLPAHLLEGDGFAVTVIDSILGVPALARRLRPSVILLDLGLPYQSGAAALAKLKVDRRTARVPVVVSAFPGVWSAERRAMAAAVLSKPLDPLALLEIVRAASASAT
jgi:CheY-like chemotaxis protein